MVGSGRNFGAWSELVGFPGGNCSVGAPLSACQEFRPSSKIPTTSDHGSKIRPLPTTAQKSDHFRPRLKNPTTSDHASKFRPIPTKLQNAQVQKFLKFVARGTPSHPELHEACPAPRELSPAAPGGLESAVSGSELVGIFWVTFFPSPGCSVRSTPAYKGFGGSYKFLILQACPKISQICVVLAHKIGKQKLENIIMKTLKKVRKMRKHCNFPSCTVAHPVARGLLNKMFTVAQLHSCTCFIRV